jgi:hypothetical protein
MLRIRASSLGLIMTAPKDKTQILSVGAKTYIKSLAKEFVYGFEEKVTSKYCDKGIQVEDQSIALYNRVFGTSYVKNTERKTNAWLTGECDIDAGGKVIDVKSSWSLATFPCLKEDAYDKDYEWQLRAYMMLWDYQKAELTYCMVNTPDELIKYEQIDLHYVDAIDEPLRVTTVEFSRDMDMEELIKVKCNAAQLYFNELVDQIANEHNYRRAA